MILVSGPNDSGKSAFAEDLICRSKGSRYYIATMVPHGEEGARRVQKHIRQRQGKGFETLELPYGVGKAEIPVGSAVLLEDVSNLLANRMFSLHGRMEDALEDILALRERCGLLVAVTIHGLPQEGYEGETLDYIRALDRLNHALRDEADAVVDMIRGSALISKGEIDAFT